MGEIYGCTGAQFDFMAYLRQSMEDDYASLVGLGLAMWVFLIVFVLLSSVWGEQSLYLLSFSTAKGSCWPAHGHCFPGTTGLDIRAYRGQESRPVIPGGTCHARGFIFGPGFPMLFFIADQLMHTFSF